jgi:hypothetical protein
MPADEAENCTCLNDGLIPRGSGERESPMRRSIEMCAMIVLCLAITACGSLRPPRGETGGRAAPQPEGETAVPEMAQDRPIVQDLPYAPVPPGGRRENLTCFTGTEDRHARIGVELVNDEVTYFAYYSKWRPRTCSLDAGRSDTLSRWTDNGTYSTVILADQKGELRIERAGDVYRFAFFDVDRRRYCGMHGKINGSLVVTRGKSSCVVQGVMDGHGDLTVR